MTVTLPKGGNVLLSAEAPGIDQVRIGLGWNDGPGSSTVELDGVVIVVESGAPWARMLLAHQVPNPAERLGAHPPPSRPLIGDAEKLVVTLSAVPAEVSRLQFGAAIFDAAGRRQTFRSVRGAYIRVLNHADSLEIVRYGLEAETGIETAMIFGELYRHATGWKFRAVGQGYATGLPGLAGAEGRDVATAHPVDVAAFLTRTSRARARRNVAEHLHPPAAPATAPSGVAPRPTARPAPAAERTPAAAPSRAAPSRPVPSRPVPSRPEAPTRASPAPSAPARSPLDLGRPSGAAPVDVARPSTGRGPARASTGPEFGERSSRYRQRHEHVTALDNDHPATTWTAAKRGSGAVSVTLRWSPLLTQTGMPRPSDLHLGALWQAGDGAVGVLQDLDDAVSAPGPGAPRQVLRLGRRDEREGQTIFVDMGALPTFTRFFVFAYGLHGAPEWALLRPVLAVAARTGEQLTIRLGESAPNARTCVVASFHVAQDDLIIRRENDFLEGPQAAVAARYGWSLEWKPDGTTLRAAP